MLGYRNAALRMPWAGSPKMARLDAVFLSKARASAAGLTKQRTDRGWAIFQSTPVLGSGYSPGSMAKGSQARNHLVCRNVVDDAYSLTGHPDLAHKPSPFKIIRTPRRGRKSGHGFLNSS